MDSINISTNKTNIPSPGVIQNSQPKPTVKTNEPKEDTFECENKRKMSTGKKAAITTGVAGTAAVTYIVTRGKNKKAGKQIVEEGKKAAQEVGETVVNSARKTIEKAEDILAQYKKVKEKVSQQPDWKDMTKEEAEEWHKYYREVYYPIKDKIKEKNISTVEKKQFSINPNEQVKEKEDYLRSVLSRTNDSEASFYDGLVEFEKYGRKESLFEGFTTNITYFKVNFPKHPSEETVNKFMDICEEFGEGLTRDEYGAVNSTDGLNFMTVISEKSAITSIDQLKRALEKGKKIIWQNRSINNLKWTLMEAEDAPYKNNKEVKEILQKFYDTAYENRKPFMEDFAKTYYDYKNKCWHYSYEQERVKHIIL